MDVLERICEYTAAAYIYSKLISHKHNNIYKEMRVCNFNFISTLHTVGYRECWTMSILLYYCVLNSVVTRDPPPHCSRTAYYKIKSYI